MSAFPKDDRYKDTGVESLGKIPEHWEAVPNPPPPQSTPIHP